MFGLAHHQRRRVRDGRLSFRCSACGFATYTLRRLLSHIAVLHQHNPGFFITCNIHGCSRGFTKFSSYRNHLYRKHHPLLVNRLAHVHERLDVGPHVEHEDLHINDDANGDMELSGDEEFDVPENHGEDVQTRGEILQKHFAMFVLKTREHHILPTSVVQNIVDDVKFLLTYATNDGNEDNPRVGEANFSCNAAINSVGSEFLLNKFCQSNLGRIEPQEFVLGQEMVNGKMTNHTMQYVPILEVLQKYLGQNDVWTSINQTQRKKANPDILEGYTAGHHFTKSDFFKQNPNALRIVLYADEFEVVNPLGSKKGQQKVLAWYFVVENVEAKYRATMRNIHLALLVKNKHVSTYGYDHILRPLIADLKKLETEGIVICVNGHNFQMVGAVIALCADNLSSHSIGRFSTCFSSGRICRFCMASKDEIAQNSDESNYVLRTTEVHAYHLNAVLTNQRYCTLYGVNGPCALSELQHFDTTKCLPPDAMHDILEGAIPFVLKTVLRELFRQRVLTYDQVNAKMKSFRYGKNDARNKSTPISVSRLRQNDNISGSAAQRMCLLRLFSFMFGEFVEEGNEAWELYLLCREMVDICLAPAIKRSWLAYLQLVVIHHNDLFSQLSPDSFPCKLHYLTHYHRLISEFGPVRNLWCMRFEAKHQYFKRLAGVIRNFRNITLTLASRHQYLQCWQFCTESMLQNEGSVYDSTEISIQRLPVLLQGTLRDIIGVPVDERDITLWKSKSVTVDSISFAENDVIIIDIVHDEEIPVFGKVKYILRHDSVWFVCVKIFRSIRFSRHFHAFEVQGTDEWHAFQAQRSKYFQALDVYEVDGKCMVTLKYKVCKNGER